MSIFNIFIAIYIDSKVKKKLCLILYTLYKLLHSATTSSNTYCSKPMHLLGHGNLFGVKIINTTRIPDKEPAFSPINGN